MRLKTTLILAMALLLFAPAAGAGGAPLTVGGFTLDRPIEEFADRVLMETALPVRYKENIQEVEIRPVAGFKSGLIAYGTCVKPDRIVRIKLKYAEESLAFFEELLRRFKRQFGEPGEYRGDPFKNFISWKWSFRDPGGNRVSLTLQHNIVDEDEKMGNAVKLQHLNRIEEDERCFRDSQQDQKGKARRSQKQPGKTGAPGWDLYVPR
jgi:hypothetical protein